MKSSLKWRQGGHKNYVRLSQISDMTINKIYEQIHLIIRSEP